MKNVNTTPSELENGERQEQEEKMTREDILRNETEIAQSLINCGNQKNNAESYVEIKIARNGKPQFSFRIRPISQGESIKCYERATKYLHKPNQPRVALNTDVALAHSYLIYTATVDEDRAKVWENKAAIDAFNLMQGVELIDRVLLAGEKDRIVDKIGEISGFNYEDADLDGLAKD